MTDQTRTILLAALACAARGWPVFPCHAPGPPGCSCGLAGCASPGKHPAVARGLRAGSTDPDRIADWWRRRPHRNLAVVTGARSGVVVLDVDPAHGGARSLAALAAEVGDLSAPAVHTGGGGTHHYFAHPGGRLASSAGSLAPGIDVRGDGGYALVPPSRHASGASYRWEELPEVLAPLPGVLLERLVHVERRTAVDWPESGITSRNESAWARAALREELLRVHRAPVGSRNVALNRAAFSLGQLVGGRHLTADTVESQLLRAAMEVGLGEMEARRTTRSGLSAGLSLPRHAPARRGAGVEPRGAGLELGP